MGVEWRNNGEAIDGEFIADVDPEDGSQVQTFKGATYREVADKLLSAQFNGSRRINELKKEIPPDPKPARQEFKPRVLTADERFQAVADADDPSKLPEVVASIIEARLGAPIEVVAERLARLDENDAIEAARNATKVWVDQTPEWYPTPENKQILWDYMEGQNMAFTVKNFGIAFDRLLADGLLTRRPETTNERTEESATERIVPQTTTRPRGSFSATGVRSQDVSHTSPVKPKPKYTRQEILEMPKATYAFKMTNEAGFAALVNTLRF